MEFIKTQLEKFGRDITILRPSKGTEDEYGDRTLTISTIGTERIFIFPIETLGRIGWTELQTIAGRWTDVDVLAIFHTDTSIQEEDFVDDGTKKWRVRHIEKFIYYNQPLFYLGFLKRLEA